MFATVRRSPVAFAVVALFMVVALVFAACNGDDDDEVVEDPFAEQTPTPAVAAEASIEITSPEGGETLSGPDVEVCVDVQDFDLRDPDEATENGVAPTPEDDNDVFDDMDDPFDDNNDTFNGQDQNDDAFGQQDNGTEQDTAAQQDEGGHIHYYMNVSEIPREPGQPALPDDGSVEMTADECHTWENVPDGEVTFAAQLVRDDHTPLDHPADDEVTVTVGEEDDDDDDFDDDFDDDDLDPFDDNGNDTFE